MPGNPAQNFLDTNTLIYLVSADTSKAVRAEALVRDGGTISVQVLNELANVGRRKIRLSWQELHVFTGTLRALLSVVPLTVDTHLASLALAERYGLSLYDGMIVAAAKLTGCRTLWSEDMQHGLVVDGQLTILNPFRPV